VVAGIAKAAAAEHRRYRDWKAALPPEQCAALMATASAIHKRHKRANARLTSSVMGRTMPDGRTPRPSQRIASGRPQAPQARSRT